jgi:hypothetical protein
VTNTLLRNDKNQRLPRCNILRDENNGIFFEGARGMKESIIERLFTLYK